MKKIISIISILHFSIHLCFTQAPGGVERYSLWKSDFNSEENINDFQENAFNYNEYEEISVYDFYKDILVDDIEIFTLFIVYRNSNSPTIASLKTESTQLNIHASFVEGNGNIPYSNTSGISNFLMYKGAGKTTTGVVENNRLHVGAEYNDKLSKDATICISELIIYDRILSSKEINKIESYLSIKYGISLPSNDQYFDSDGGIVLDTFEIKNFTHQVTAIGRDNTSKLITNQSYNHYTQSLLAIGIDTIKQKNMNNPGYIGDGEFMFWSNNGGANDFVKTDVQSDVSILDKKWKINVTGASILNNRLHFKIPEDKLKNVVTGQNLFMIVSDRPFKQSQLQNYEPIFMTLDNQYYQCHLSDINTSKKEMYITIIQKVAESDNIDQLIAKLTHPKLVLTGQNFKVTVSEFGNTNGRLTISDTNGRLLSTFNVDAGANQDHTIDTHFEVAGTYFISFSQNNMRPLTGKIIAQ